MPTSLFGMVLLPIAYFTFLLMMNSKSLLGNAKPTGGKHGEMERPDDPLATGLATFCCMWSIYNSSHPVSASHRWGSWQCWLWSYISLPRGNRPDQPKLKSLASMLPR
ncbi:MAG: hypothetical protein R3B91_19660 [Planctomycetaceae bacterium]